MVIFFKKSLRCIFKNKLSYFLCIFLISVGIICYSSMSISYSTILIAKEQFYQDYNFGDIFAEVKAIPTSSIQHLKRIEGIKDVNSKITVEANVIINGEKKASLKLVSYDKNENTINKVKIYDGKISENNQILLSKSFMESNKINTGDILDLIIQGKKYSFTVTGKAESPEFIYIIKNPLDPIPDTQSYSFGYINANELREICSMNSLSNDLSFELKQGYTFDDVKENLKESLLKYGLKNLYEKKEHISEKMLTGQINSLKGISQMIPSLMVFTTSIMLYIMIKRTIERERTQIGTLKAFGYTNTFIILNYMFYGIFVGTIGGITGGIIGNISSQSIIQSFITLFNLPKIEQKFSYDIFINGVFISIFTGIIGTFFGVTKILKLSPSEAMRPSSPDKFKKSIFKNLKGNKYFLMSLRNIERNKIRSLFIIIGITFAFSIITYMSSYNKKLSTIMNTQYENIQLHDFEIILANTVDLKSAVNEVNMLSDVNDAEGTIDIGVKIYNGNLEETASITGIEINSNMYKIYDYDTKKNIIPSKNGIILSSMLARKLNAHVGDILKIESDYLKDNLDIIVTDIVTQYMGANSYMDINALCRLFNSNTAVSKIQIKTDNPSRIFSKFEYGKNVLEITEKEKNKIKYIENVNSSKSMVSLMLTMSILIAFAIIYNISNISLEEQKREFSTLRILGMSVYEVSKILAYEYLVLYIISVIIGVPFTIIISNILSKALETDTYYVPASTPIICFIYGMFGCFISVFLSNLWSMKNIKKLNLLEVLKEKE